MMTTACALKAYETFRLDQPVKGVLRLTLSRPQTANAINTTMALELLDFWSERYREPVADWRCIVLQGEGRAFCGGADLKERNGLSEDQWYHQHAIFEQAFTQMLRCPIPVLSAVNGAAFGGGLELILASDFAYALSSATFGFPEVKRGIIPGCYGTQSLPRACGVRRAKEIILTGEPFTAHEALQWGIVNRLFQTEAELSIQILDAAGRIATSAPQSVRQAKKTLDLSTQVDLQTGYSFEVAAFNSLVLTDDRKEGVAAFNEKRPPVFTGK